jgi:hypothetical protein
VASILEYVYHDNDNTIDLILQADGVAVPLAAVTKIELGVAGTVYSSTNLETDPIRWNQTGYAVGEIRLHLGLLDDLVDTPRAWITVFDASTPNGIRWGYIKLKNFIPVDEETA